MSNNFKPGDEVLLVLDNGDCAQATFVRYNKFDKRVCWIDFNDDVVIDPTQYKEGFILTSSKLGSSVALDRVIRRNTPLFKNDNPNTTFKKEIAYDRNRR